MEGEPGTGQEQAQVSVSVAEALRDLKRGTSWFYWIAGLSIVNSLVIAFGGNWNFLIGLGITQIVDGIAWGIGDALNPGKGVLILKLIALAIDIGIAGGFALLGFFAHRKRSKALYIIGIVLYAIDGLIILPLGAWLNALFHLLALWGLYGGLKAIKKLEAAAPPM